MHSDSGTSPDGQVVAVRRNSRRRSLGIAATLYLLLVAGVTSAPTAAPDASDGYQSATATAPFAAQTAAVGELAPPPEAPGAKARGAAQQPAANKVRELRGFAANAPASKPPNTSAQPGIASSRIVDKASGVPAAVSSNGYRSPGTLHKISVNDPQLAHRLQAQGARLIADYGSFVVMQASDPVVASLTNSKDAQVVDENNLVLLNSGAIDTSTPAAQALRVAPDGAGGKQMRLIQFAGPIQPEWYAALVATGVRIVTYIPSNTYLVYGTATTLLALRQLAANTAIVQWDAPYTAAYRIDPAITALPGTKSGAAQEQVWIARRPG